MNQQCKVCGEPAAGFHFGAFTCEGCKSFFGRSYNNLNSISDCKNNGECIINKKNRTSCKACRLRKCLMVGMSKSGSRYGRRSNWFKIHCLLQEQQQQAASHTNRSQKSPPPVSHSALSMLGHPDHHQLAAAMSHHQDLQGRNPSTWFKIQCLLQEQQQQAASNKTNPSLQGRTKEEMLLLGLDEYKNSTSPSVSSPESHNSDTSVEVSESKLLVGGSLFLNNSKCSIDQHSQRASSNGIIGKDMFLPLPFSSLGPLAHVFPHSAAFLPPTAPAFNPTGPQHSAFLFPPRNYLYQNKTSPSLVTNNNNTYTHNNNDPLNVDMYSKRFYLDAILQSQRPSSGGSTSREGNEEEDGGSERNSSPKHQEFSTCKPKSLAMSILSTFPNQDDAVQENPMDLSMKNSQRKSRNNDRDRRLSNAESLRDEMSDPEDEDEGELDVKSVEGEDECNDMASDHEELHSQTVVPVDLTTKA